MSSPSQRLDEVLQLLARTARTAGPTALVDSGANETGLFFDSGALAAARLTEVHASGAGRERDPRRQALRFLAAAAGGGFDLTSREASPSGGAAAPDAQINASDLILDLVREADPVWIREQMDHPDWKPGPPAGGSGPAPEVAMGDIEKFLLSRADGTLPLPQLLSLSPVGESQTRAALCGLVRAGLIKAPDPGGKGSRPRPAADPPAARSEPAPQARSTSALDAFLSRTEGSASPPEAVQPASGDPPQAGAYARSLEDERLYQEVQLWLAECRGADYYGILKVSPTASEGEVRKAYYKVAKKFHPDLLRLPLFEEIFPEIEATFASSTDAYNTLTDQSARAQYEKSISEGKSTAKKDIDQVGVARDSYLRGKKHLEAGEMFDALRLFETATEMDPSKAEYWSHLAQVQEKNSRWRKRAEQSYLKAIELAPAEADHYLSLARLYEAGHLKRRAVEMYQNALQWDPGNEEALAALGMQESEEGMAGKLRSMFKSSKS